MSGQPAYDPLAPYTARRYCPALGAEPQRRHACPADFWYVPQLYEPSVRLRREPWQVTAIGKGVTQVVYDLEDIFSWKKKVVEREVSRNMQGRIGEKALYLILQLLINEIVKDAHAAGYLRSGGVALSEDRKERGAEGDIIDWKGRYAFQFKRKTSLRLFRKVRDQPNPRGEIRKYKYRRQEGGLNISEIDGMADFEVEDRSYLVIGEVTTQTNKGHDEQGLQPNTWRKGNLDERIFNPLHALYPKHHLIYLFMAPHEGLFVRQNGRICLRERTAQVAELLRRRNVSSVMVPIPSTLDCGELTREYYEELVCWRSARDGILERI